MDAPPPQESVALFCAAAAALEPAGVNLPRVHHRDDDAGFAILDDFGDATYLDALRAGADPDELYAPALESLAAIQSLGEGAALPPYSEDMLLSEMRLYPEWYARRELGAELDGRERRVLGDAFARIAAEVSRQPRAPVHRDYHCRNLMATDPLPGILDFQDAAVGPFTYDMLSLVRDAYVSWDEERIGGWIRDFLALARERRLFRAVGEEEYRRALDWTGAQRLLKVVGIFSRLAHRDGKAGYLGDLPRAEDNLLGALGRLPELADLAGVVRGLRERRLAR